MLPLLKVNDSLSLKLIGLEDVNAIFYIIDTQKDYIGEFLPFIYMTKRVEDTQKFVKSCMQNLEKGLGFIYVILYLGRLIGIVSCGIDKVNNKLEFGYWLNQDYQGKGIMTDSVGYLTRYLLLEQGFNRLMIRCTKTNVKSQTIPKKLGYTLEVNEREAFRSTDGTYSDIYVYSKIKKDLDKTSGK